MSLPQQRARVLHSISLVSPLDPESSSSSEPVLLTSTYFSVFTCLRDIDRRVLPGTLGKRVWKLWRVRSLSLDNLMSIDDTWTFDTG